MVWRVVEQDTGGDVDRLLLGDDDDDQQRIGVTVTGGLDGPIAEAVVVYPCRACGWASACDEECHS